MKNQYSIKNNKTGHMKTIKSITCHLVRFQFAGVVLSNFFVFLSVFIFSNGFSQSQYYQDVKGWENVVSSGTNVIVIEKAYIIDNHEPSITGDGDIGIHIYKGNDSKPIKQLRLYGPHCGGSDNGPQCEWSDNEIVTYSNYGIISWKPEFGDYLKIKLQEGDDFPGNQDDVLLNKIINVNLLSNSSVKLSSNSAELWIKIYPVFPQEQTSGFLKDVQFMRLPPYGKGGNKFQDPPSLEEGSNTNYVLVGILVNYGRLVDGITPIYREVTINWKLGRKIYGTHIGGNGGEYVKEIYWDGYVVTGLNVRVGDKLDNIQLVYNSWNNGVIGETKYFSDACGGNGGALFRLQCPDNRVAVGLHGMSGRVIDVVSLITARIYGYRFPSQGSGDYK
jgi:hypothetical protein